jgi:hypothetical protein
MSRKVWPLVWLLLVTCTLSVVATGCSGPDAPKRPTGDSTKT